VQVYIVGASLFLIADFRCTIPRDRGYRFTIDDQCI